MEPLEFSQRDEPWVRREIKKLKARIAEANPHFWKFYSIGLRQKFPAKKRGPRHEKVAAQAEAIGIHRVTLWEALTRLKGAGKPTRALLAEITHTLPEVWGLKGDLELRWQALNEWWRTEWLEDLGKKEER
jgi:hypothetical protein